MDNTIIWKIGKIAENEIRPLFSAVFEIVAKFLSIGVKDQINVDW